VKLALALLLAFAATADASPAKAKAHFKQGRAFFDRGNYERAIDEYKQAYAIDARPELLFNIAQAYRLSKKRAEALDYFKQYLAAQPDGAGAAEARRHVETLTKQIEQDQARPPDAPPPPPAPTPPEPSAPTVLVVYRDPNPGRGLRIGGLATMGAGAIALGVGLKFAFDARDAEDQLSSFTGDTWTRREEDIFDAGERANRNMKIMYAIGGTLVVGGGVLFYLGMRANIAPVVTTETVGVAVRGEL
jgi:tetratricopeptide (TPR) repeat protein